MSKKFAAVVLLIVLVGIAHVPARAAAVDFLARNRSISIYVDCLDTAAQRVSDMPGIDLHSSMSAEFASFERLAGNADLPYVLGRLRSLGDFAESRMSAHSVFIAMSNLQADFDVRTDEYNRLMELMHQVETIEDFGRVERRLFEVIWQLDSMRSNLSRMELEIDTTFLSITLHQVPVLPPEDPAAGVFARIGAAFWVSVRGTRDAVQVVVLRLVIISIPLLAVIVLGRIIWWLAGGRVKRSIAAAKNLHDNLHNLHNAHKSPPPEAPPKEASDEE